MKEIHVLARKLRTTRVLALGLILVVLLAACGSGTQPQAQSASTQAVSPGNNAGQDNNAGQNGQRGDAEFGLTETEVARRVDAVESQIAACMRDAGFEYIPVDYATARAAMDSNSKPSGLNADEFRAQFGYGITTLFAGADSQAAMGAGEQNIRIRSGLSAAIASPTTTRSMAKTPRRPLWSRSMTRTFRRPAAVPGPPSSRFSAPKSSGRAL